MNNPIGSSIGSLLSDLRGETTTLLRQEVALAKAELSQKAAQAGRNALEIATGGAVAYAGAIVLLIGVGFLLARGLVALGLDENLAQWLGLVLVGLVVALIGWGMLAKAKKGLTAENLKPRETAASLQDNKRWAENKIHSAHEPAT